MIVKKVISIILTILFLLPPTQGWSQKLEEQAQYYLQAVGPGQVPKPTPPARPELPQQGVTPPAPVQILTSAPRQLEDISAIERRAWKQKIFIKQFGYSFFYQPPATFLPVQNVPVGPDYVIGPGDTVRIVLWGSVQGEYSLTVDRNGNIEIPKVGVVHVSSLNYRQLREVLDREFIRQYTNYQMNVTLDNLRTIQVYVVGQARFPGTYAVSSLSTLVSALFAAGGPSKSGSLRNIQVRRQGKIIAQFDMYDFLLHGDKRKDVRLLSEDVIFIPPIGPLAAIGSPKTKKEIEEDLLIISGKERVPDKGVRIEKEVVPETEGLTEPEVSPGTEEGTEKETISGTEPSSGTERDLERRLGMSLADGGRKRKTDLGGPVKVPGIYELKNEKTLMDLVQLAGGLGDTAFKGRVQVLRVKGRQEMVLFDEDLEKFISRHQDLKLVDGDFIKIFPVPTLVEKTVVIAGAVKDPGEYGFHDDMRVKDLIGYAGGLLLQANKEEAELNRTNITPQGPKTSRIYVRPYRVLSGVASDNILLKPNDYLFIRTVPDWSARRTVKILGEAKFPGTYAIKKGETLSSVLERAGGFTDKAYPLAAVLTRRSTKEIQKRQLKAAIDRLESEILALSATKAQTGVEPEEAKRAEVMAKQQIDLLASLRKVEPLGRVIIRLDDPERLRGTPEDIELQAGDRLVIPEVQNTVNVVGAVFSPTAIVYTANRSVSDYITMAGGTTKIADDKEIYVIKVNGAAVSRKGFKWLGASWDGTKYIYQPGGLGSLRLDPGDTIVIPEQLERIAWLKEIKDIATIIGQIALTAGVVLIGLK